VENLENFGKDVTGISVNGLRCGKLILEMIGDLEMLVHMNLTEFIRCLSVSGEVDFGSIGQELRDSSGEVLRERTRGFHVINS
jgi:hypothetical protein